MTLEQHISAVERAQLEYEQSVAVFVLAKERMDTAQLDAEAALRNYNATVAGMIATYYGRAR